MPKPKPNQDLVEMLCDLLASARHGEITEAYAVVRFRDGEYDDEYVCEDLQLLLSEVQQLALRARIQSGMKDRAH